MTSLVPATPISLRSPSLFSLLLRSAQEQPDRLALIDGDTGDRATYAQLRDTVVALGAGLVAAGVRPGDRVAILAKNSKAYVELLWAIARVGAICVPMNVRLNPRELAANLRDCAPAAIITDIALVTSADAACTEADVPRRWIIGEAVPGWTSLAEVTADLDEAALAQAAAHADEVDGESTGTLLYTSGTTGQAKGCALAQRTWPHYAMNLAAALRMDRDDVYLALLPYFHVAGLGMVMSQLILGGTVVTQSVPDPARMHTLIDEHDVSVVFVVPGISAPFVEHSAARPSSVRLVVTGAGLERRDIPAQVRTRLGATCIAIYGQTEAGTYLTWATEAQLVADPATYGQVMPAMAYRIVNVDGADAADGEPGELLVRGGSVMQGYWNRPEATAETLADGWLHTGDVFVRTPDGHVRMVDRAKYLIKTGGENVYPQEVENVLRTHPAVADVAVVGVPHEHWGEAVKAFVVPAGGDEPSRQELSQWVRQEVAGYKVPKYVEFVGEIPRNVSGKVLKGDLAERPVLDEHLAEHGSTP